MKSSAYKMTSAAMNCLTEGGKRKNLGRDAVAKHELEVLFLGALIWLQLAIMCPEEQVSNHPSF